MKKFMLIISIITFAVCNLFAQKDLETCRPQSSTYWTGRCDLYSKHNGEIKVGLATGNKFRGWSKFDISNIPDNAVINSIILKFWVNDPTTDNHYLIITKVSSNPVTASYSTLWNQIYNGTWYAEQYNCGLTTGYK